jgi:K+-sensing histidine kinase KdpD
LATFDESILGAREFAPGGEEKLALLSPEIEKAGGSYANIPELSTSVRAPDDALLECIRSELRALLSQRSDLADSEKAAAVEEKTLRVAHDIRNLLATIQAVCDSLLLETEDPEKRERLQLISSQVDRLAFALSKSVGGATALDESPTFMNLGDLGVSLVNLLRYQNDDDLVFTIQVESGLCCRLPERGHSRSLFELLHNATNAVNGQDVAKVHLACRHEEGHVEIEVMDNGPGRPPQLLKQGLRAYSAAAPALGLCSVERFVGGLEGQLMFAESATGGALVRMILPVDCFLPGRSQSPETGGYPRGFFMATSAWHIPYSRNDTTSPSFTGTGSSYFQCCRPGLGAPFER